MTPYANEVPPSPNYHHNSDIPPYIYIICYTTVKTLRSGNYLAMVRGLRRRFIATCWLQTGMNSINRDDVREALIDRELSIEDAAHHLGVSKYEIERYPMIIAKARNGNPPFTRDELTTAIREERLSETQAAEKLDVSKDTIQSYKAKWAISSYQMTEAEKRLDPILSD